MDENTPPPASSTEPSPEPVPAAPMTAGAETNQQARNFAMLCHVLSLAGFVVPLGNVIGPLIMWLVKKDEFPFVDEQGKEAVNFNITVLIAAIVSAILTVILIGILLLLAVVVTWLVFTIIAAVKASGGEHYRYPLTLRLIK